MLTEPALKTITFPGALRVANAIKLSVATVAGVATYTGGSLDGAIGTSSMVAARTLSVTLAANAGSYVNGSTITVTGLDAFARVQSEVLSIIGIDGGIVIYGTKIFGKVNQIVIQAQTNVGGHFQFGVSDAFVAARMVRVGTIGNLSIAYEDGTLDTIINLRAGEPATGMIARVLGASTAQDITAFI